MANQPKRKDFVNRYAPVVGAKWIMRQELDELIEAEVAAATAELERQNELLAGALREAKNELVSDLKDFGDCDHSVGVCVCSLKNTIERAENALKAEGK